MYCHNYRDNGFVTCLSCRKCKSHDIIQGPKIVMVQRVKGQGCASTAPQVYQHCGVNHGNWVATGTLPVPNGYIMWCSLIIPLQKRKRCSTFSRFTKDSEFFFFGWNTQIHYAEKRRNNEYSYYSNLQCIVLSSIHIKCLVPVLTFYSLHRFASRWQQGSHY